MHLKKSLAQTPRCLTIPRTISTESFVLKVLINIRDIQPTRILYSVWGLAGIDK